MNDLNTKSGDSALPKDEQKICKYICVRWPKFYCGYGIVDGKTYRSEANIKITDILVDPRACQPENCEYYIKIR